MISKIKIGVAVDEGKTRLKDSFYNAPYKVVHFGSSHSAEHLELIVMSASPGILDGDSLDMNIDVAEGSRFKLFTQSFNKLHPMKSGAYQEISLHLKRDTVFQYIPHPVIPFDKSIFKAKSTLHVDAESTLIWGDILSSGRVHSGESFAFTKYQNQTKIFFDGKPEFFDNQLIIPSEQPVNSILFYEGYTHQATLVYISKKAGDLKLELDEILTGRYSEIEFGFSQCSDHGVVIRALGKDGELMYDWLATMGQLCWEFTVQDQPVDDQTDHTDIV
jgi:urease accessory protein